MIRYILIALWLLATSAPVLGAETRYQLIRGSKALCDAFLDRKNEIQYVKPYAQRTDRRWHEYKDRCPDFLKKKPWMPYPNRDFDDYALFSVDVDNDGEQETVLYRRYDKEYFVTYSTGGREYRKQEGIEVNEEFLKVDLTSCTMEQVFWAYEKNQLLKLDGVTYIQNLNPHDRGKAFAIYKKQKGIALKGGYQDAICVFRQQ